MRMKKANRYIFLALTVILATGCGRDYTQSETLNEFGEMYEKHIQSFYFYPSTVRMLSEILGQAGTGVLSEVRQGRIFVSWDTENIELMQALPGIKTGVESEGFEMLMRMKHQGVNIDAYIKDGKIPSYVLFFNDPESPFIVEVAGSLSAKSIQELSTLDLNKANEIFNIIPQKEIEESDLPDEMNQSDSTRSKTIRIHIP